MSSSTNVIEVVIQPHKDQKPGTSGLRKRVSVFSKSTYTESFIQSILEATSPTTLIVGGDGRYYSYECIRIIVSICAANGVKRLIIGKDGILSTPAASALIVAQQADGGLILTASHNPGGKDGDFGIKYNIKNGSPAPESLTNQIYEISCCLKVYKMLLKRPQLDLSQIGQFQVANTKVEVIDPVDNYLNLMKQCFDFAKISPLLKEQAKLNILVDCMNGVMGPYAKRILIEELGAPISSVINAEPLEDFGGKHPDPNLIYARDLVDQLRADSSIDLGCAFDGDGDRNMLIGERGFFVNPSDSLAIIAYHHNCIKFFKKSGLAGVARSFPTAPALDRVAQDQKIPLYETPTGWKFFCNLLESGKASLCGEESFGTGSSHIREKDGMWALLAWLSIIVDTGKSVEQVCMDHWAKFGRDYYIRYDFEEMDSDSCKRMMDQLSESFLNSSLIGQKYGPNQDYVITENGHFSYTDPVDKSVTTNQGAFIKFDNGSRIVIRFSGTGSTGTTVRFYFNRHTQQYRKESKEVLKDLIEIALQLSRIQEFTGTNVPTVIT